MSSPNSSAVTSELSSEKTSKLQDHSPDSLICSVMENEAPNFIQVTLSRASR